MIFEQPFPLGTVRVIWDAGEEFCASINARLITERSEYVSITGLPVEQSSVSHIGFSARLSTSLSPGSRLRIESASGMWFDAIVVNRDGYDITEITSDSVVHDLRDDADEPVIVSGR